MRLICSLPVALALCASPLAAVAQSDIYLDLPQSLEYRLRVSIAPGTQQVYCYQQDRLAVIGSVTVASGTTATVPVRLSDPVIRCAACNSHGCSSLSSNAAVIVPLDPLDRDMNGVINVSDMVMCTLQIQSEIY